MFALNFGISLINRMKSRGPRIDAYKLFLLILTSCSLLRLGNYFPLDLQQLVYSFNY